MSVEFVHHMLYRCDFCPAKCVGFTHELPSGWCEYLPQGEWPVVRHECAGCVAKRVKP